MVLFQVNTSWPSVLERPIKDRGLGGRTWTRLIMTEIVHDCPAPNPSRLLPAYVGCSSNDLCGPRPEYRRPWEDLRVGVVPAIGEDAIRLKDEHRAAENPPHALPDR